MTPPPSYIDLNRTFSPLPLEAATEESALQSYASRTGWLGRRNELSWNDVLKYPLVVLLGEPGSGKTYELQNQATLSSPGFSRFYLRLDEMAAWGKQLGLHGDDAERFEKWRESRERGIFSSTL
jgi:hypothetical protein